MLLVSAFVENGCQIGTAAKPVAGGHDHARVHVNGRNIGVPGMGDEGNAGCPKARVLICAGYLFAEILGKFAVNGGRVNTDLFKQATVHHRHYAAAALALIALPGCGNEFAGGMF